LQNVKNKNEVFHKKAEVAKETSSLFLHAKGVDR
jgi:hypothetical protein